MGRKAWWVVGVAVGVWLGGASSRPALAQGKPLTLRLSAVVVNPSDHIYRYVMNNRLIEKHAKPFGYDLKVEYSTFATGPAMIEALIANKTDVILAGPLPTVSQMIRGAETYILDLIEGHVRMALVVPPGSPIKSVEDVVSRKAVVGLSIGTSTHQFIENLLLARFGKTAEDMGIPLKNVSPSEAATMPKGLDAVIVWDPHITLMETKGLGEVLVDSYGSTGKGSGVGAGKKLEFFKNAYGYPEDFIMHRTPNLVSRRFAKEHPKVLVAYLVAKNEALRILAKYPSGYELSYELVKSWGLPKEVTFGLLKDNLVGGIRDWSYLTESDLFSYVMAADWMYRGKRISAPLTWDTVKEYVTFTAALQKEAWELMGRYPSIEEMTRTDTPDRRGYPAWMMERWKMEKPPAR
jgi:ABC-type nitrate/sulfonate/bicarbonate transport system substrate-binding protein